jgi:LacI family repressor for deo operon, udp, cdd, tsx, nupC, and nupG
MPVAVGDSHVDGGEAAMRSLLERAPDLTAVLCHNDLTAIGAMRALRAVGRSVPYDVSVVGFDDIGFARYVEPALTTVAQPTAEMGRWAVEAVLDLLLGKGDELTPVAVVRFPVELRERASTAPAARDGPDADSGDTAPVSGTRHAKRLG